MFRGIEIALPNSSLQNNFYISWTSYMYAVCRRLSPWTLQSFPRVYFQIYSLVYNWLVPCLAFLLEETVLPVSKVPRRSATGRSRWVQFWSLHSGLATSSINSCSLCILPFVHVLKFRRVVISFLNILVYSSATEWELNRRSSCTECCRGILTRNSGAFRAKCSKFIPK